MSMNPVTMMPNLKQAEQPGGKVVFRDHFSTYFPIPIDGKQRTYIGNDDFEMTIGSSVYDYTNLEDGMLLLEVAFNFPNGVATEKPLSSGYLQAYIAKQLTFGGLSFLRRNILTCGDVIISDHDYCNVDIATEIQGRAPKHYKEYMSWLWLGMSESPILSDVYGAALDADLNSPRVWIMAILPTPLDNAGFINTYQLHGRLKIHIYLASQHEVFRPYPIPPCEELAGDWYSSAAAAAPTSDFSSIVDTTMNWTMYNAIWYAHGIMAREGAVLDVAPLEVWTRGRKAFRLATTGAPEEDFVFGMGFRSMVKAKFIFVDPECWRSQNPMYSGLDCQWRAGRLGGVSGSPGAEVAVEEMITWSSLNIGGHEYPTNWGMGRLNAPNFQANEPFIFHSFLSYMERNDSSGDQVSKMLSEYDELCHPWFAKYFGPDAAMNGAYLNPFQGGTIICAPSWYGYAACFLRGKATRLYPVAEIAAEGVSEWDTINADYLPGGLFGLYYDVRKLNKQDSLLQGDSMQNYNAHLFIQRQGQIVDTLTHVWSDSGEQEIDTGITVPNAPPILLGFFEYDLHILFGDGTAQVSV